MFGTLIEIFSKNLNQIGGNYFMGNFSSSNTEAKLKQCGSFVEFVKTMTK